MINRIKQSTIVGLDIETTMTRGVCDPYIDEITAGAIAVNGEANLYLNIAEFGEKCKHIFNDPSATIVIHNTNFDLRFIIHNFFYLDWRPSAYIYDTMVVERSFNAGRLEDTDTPSKKARIRNDLGSTIERRLGITLNKGVRDDLVRVLPQYWTDEHKEYVINDVKYLEPLMNSQLKDIEKWNMENAIDIENKIALIGAYTQLRGTEFDLDKYWQIYEDCSTREKKLREQIYSLLNVRTQFNFLTGLSEASVNLDSPHEMLRVLNKHGVNVKAYEARDLTDFWVTNSSVYPNKFKNQRTGRATQQQLDLVRLILDWKHYSKMLTWNYDKDINPVTKRMHGSIRTFGADTARMSMSKPNLQQTTSFKPIFSGSMGVIGKGEDGFLGQSPRPCFVPGEGRKMIVADLSQIEYRIMAELSNERWMIDAFNQGKDFHKSRTAQVLGIPYDKVSKEQRSGIGKPVNFGLGYRGGAGVLYRMVQKFGYYRTMVECELLVRKVNMGQPNINRWAANMLKQIEDKGYIQTPVGHIRWINPEKDGKYSPQKAANTPVQSFAAGAYKQGVIYVWEEMPSDLHMHLFVHDEIGSSAPEHLALEISKDVIVPNMVRGAQKYLHKVKASSDAEIGDCWIKA